MKELNVGELVLQYSYGRVIKTTVTSITPAGNYKVGGQVYNKTDGKLRGAGSSFSRHETRIEPFDADKWAKLVQAGNDRNIKRGVQDAINAGVVTVEMYRAIYAIIYPAKKVGE